MNDDSINLNEHGLALLALQLRDSGDTTPAANLTDDELMALYEGHLNDTERVRVLRCIADNKEVYGRWLSLVEANNTVDSSFAAVAAQQPTEKQHNATAADAFTTHNNPTAWRRLKEKLRAWLRPLTYSGGALAAAAVVFLLVSPGTSDYQTTLDQLYADYGNESKELLRTSDSLPTKSAGQWPNTTKTIRYTPVETALAKGMLAGLQTLGDDVSIPGVEIDAQNYSNEDQLPQADRAALASLGRLLALTYIRCQNTGREDYYPRAALILAQIDQQLSPANYDELKIMTVMHEQRAGSDAEARKKAVSKQHMCTLSGNVIDRFRV